jgi:hypothetical protein
MIAALIVLALGGGFGGLSALGQLVSGPAVPVSATAGATGPGTRASHRTAPLVLPVVPAAPATARAPTRLAATSPRPGVRPGASGSSAGGRTIQRLAPGGRSAAPPVTPPPARTTQPPPPPTPTPAPVAPLPALVNQVVAVGVAVTSKLPDPVGALGTGVLQTLGQTLDTLLTPPS